MDRPQTTLHVSLIAKEFHRLIREELPQKHVLAQIDGLNEDHGDDTCATHDFCDANMPMATAFEEVMDRELDCASEDDTTLWNMAWGLAKCNGFSKYWDDRPRAG